VGEAIEGQDGLKTRHRAPFWSPHKNSNLLNARLRWFLTRWSSFMRLERNCSRVASVQEALWNTGQRGATVRRAPQQRSQRETPYKQGITPKSLWCLKCDGPMSNMRPMQGAFDVFFLISPPQRPRLHPHPDRERPGVKLWGIFHELSMTAKK